MNIDEIDNIEFFTSLDKMREFYSSELKKLGEVLE
jgi:hypothetical protein